MSDTNRQHPLLPPAQLPYVVFRREPLWQVSMNVRINHAARCAYDPEENVIRLTLKERVPSAKPEDSESMELVIYALKVGPHPMASS